MVTMAIDRAKVDKLFQVTRDKQGKATGYTQPLFLTASEIHDTHRLVDAAHMEDKLESASAPQSIAALRPSGWMGGLRDSINKHGYDWTQPLESRVDHKDGDIEPVLTEGHHRLTVMAADRPNDFIPVTELSSIPHHNPSLQERRSNPKWFTQNRMTVDTYKPANRNLGSQF